ncbi:hypothetical protein [Hymenobacter metallilatus]|uniref:Uncharacterized protein n=1 Tax=Hymenobacter metallilatus TaxID=2493666 RepID=A0A3R9PBV2_9BACT|nr:hypothetical protein [Hymenobacter metallilatus]RSK33155.1 hypothetical protein EI290_10595 [Hymenobacter metallilatus]
MQPEDIDKLFRDRLADHAPTPPAFLWDEIAAEIQPRKRRPVLWLAAAAVALLALLGGTWWVVVGGAGHSATQPEMAAATPRRPAAPATKNSVQPQATPAPTSPSSPSEAPAPEPAAAVATAVPSSETRSVGVQPDPASEARRPDRPRASDPRQLAQATTRTASPELPAPALQPTRPERGPEPEPSPLPELATHSVALTGPIEVEVRPAAVAPAPAAPAHRPRLVSLLRQARNVVQGEKVSLTAAGIPETVTVQARVAGHTLTKVIQL